jgi:hypothetical protein
LFFEWQWPLPENRGRGGASSPSLVRDDNTFLGAPEFLTGSTHVTMSVVSFRRPAVRRGASCGGSAIFVSA